MPYTVSDYWLFQRKKGGSWYYGLRIDGRKIHKSTKTKDKKKAERIARREYAKAKRLQGSKGFDAETATAKECFEVFKQRRLKNRNEKDRINHDNYAKRFREFFGGGEITLSEISTFQIEDWRDWLVTQYVFSEGKK